MVSDRRMFLGTAGLAACAAAVWSGLGKRRKRAPRFQILEACPGGRVKVELQAERAVRVDLEVRRAPDGAATLVDRVTVASGERASIDLRLDLPEPTWAPGTYLARVKVVRSQGQMWSSDWLPAFEAHAPPWLG